MINDTSIMNRFARCRHGGLLESLGERRMGMRCARDILRAGAILECQDTFRNHLTGIRADDVNAQNPIGFRIGQEFDQAVAIEVGLCTTVRAEGECADLVFDTRLFQFGLVLADPCHFRVCVHDGGDGTVVDVTIVFGEEFDRRNSFFFCFVSKHGTECAITNDSDMGDLGAVLAVDDDTATVVGLETDSVQAKAGCVRATSNGNQDNIGIELYSAVSIVVFDVSISVGLTVCSLPPFAASTLSLTVEPLSSPLATFVLSINFIPCFVSVF